MAQWVKDLILSLLWYKSDPWPRNFCLRQVWPKKKKIKNSSFELQVYPTISFLYSIKTECLIGIKQNVRIGSI